MSNSLDHSDEVNIEPTTLVDLLRWRAAHQPDQRAYTFLLDGEADSRHLTYSELDEKARAIAARLQHLELIGQRALLLFPPGLDYIAALFGCLYADVVAVPAYPPRPNRPMPRIQAIVADAGARVALTNASTFAVIERQFEQAEELAALQWIVSEEVGSELAEEWREVEINAESLAFLQYTSGSTSAPKGVMLTYRNLLYNLSLISHGFESSSESQGVIWLPPYHDMGLIGGILQPLYVGFPVVLMSPVHFLQRPVRWLQAISHYKATISGGPNFAYDLCLRKITPEQRAALDLSSWSVAFNGAEPIRADTLQSFAEMFEPCGFRPEAFYPCYGLAEATLIVSGGLKTALPNIYTCQGSALERHRVVTANAGDEGCRTLLGCGQGWTEQQIRIVNPQSLSLCPPEQVGEVWVSGPSVAVGYWNQAQLSELTFQAHLADSQEGPYLRTGDFGFFADGELVITGRSKDLIIIAGRNHYPQDIERMIEESHDALRTGHSAAFAIEVDGQEQLVVTAEVERQWLKNLPVAEVVSAIRQMVAQEYDVQIYAVVLLKTGSIAKTSSGKIQRHVCRSEYENGDLQMVGEWRLESDAQKASASDESEISETVDMPQQSHDRTKEIQIWLVAKLSERLKVDPNEIKLTEPFARYGMDSATAVGLTDELGDWLGRRLSPTLAYEYPTIKALARHLAEQPETSAATSNGNARQGVDHEPIAIIGIGCRFPGAHNPEAFWQLLREGVDAITEVPEDRWDRHAFYDEDRSVPGKMNTRWGGFLDQVDQFDPQFFGISPREAVCMDPQQRLLLEVTWEALEDAGQSAQSLAGTATSVFVGISTNDYGRLQLGQPTLIDAYTGTGNSLTIAANRLSYFFDFRGPSMAIDTACSSSLVAVHLACQSLWKGESTLALAGGVNLILSPAIAINFTKSGAMAPDGRCKTFDARANGYVRSEGAGIILLKPLSRALADADPIYAVIRGSAINQDGRTNGLMAPNPLSQEAVLREAYGCAGVSPGQVQYVEAHGTGTLLGDPIEAKALGAILASDRPPGERCILGSVKTNIGHLEAAAGVAGLIKTALSLKHRMIPPSLHFQQPNPHIPFADLPLRVQQKLDSWPETSGPALAGVSSFGFGGTNAHVVLEEAPRAVISPDQAMEAPANEARLLPLSAHSPEALRSLAQAYRRFLADADSGSAASLRDMCYTASVRRSHHDCRLALLFHSLEELIERLEAFLQEEMGAGIFSGRKHPSRSLKLAFVFSGQGPQWWAMGRELMAQEAVFRAALEECDKLLSRYASWSLIEELTADESASRLDGDDISITQVALFAIQVALATLWRSWGIEPDAVVGHSMGEAAAAYVAGCLSLEDAIRVIFNRSQLLQGATQQGAMAMVELSFEEATAAISQYENRISIAACNGPSSMVLSGDTAALDQVLQALQEKGIFCRRLRTTGVAAHSPQVEPFRGTLIRKLEGLKAVAGRVRMISTVTGDFVEGCHLNPAYWGRHLREPVLFSEAVKRLASDGYDVFIEISPHPILAGSISECLHRLGQEGTVLTSLRREQEERAMMLSSAGALYARGYPLDWRKMYRGGERCVPLPSYPWQRERCWLESEESGTNFDREQIWQNRGSVEKNPLLGRYLQSANPSGNHFWEIELDRRLFPYLDDHRVSGVLVLPGAVYVEMAMAAATQAFGAGALSLKDIAFQRALILPEDGARTVQMILSPDATGEASFQIYSRPVDAEQTTKSWTLHVTGKISQGQAESDSDVLEPTVPEKIQSLGAKEISSEDYYLWLRERGIEYGPSFQGIERLWRRDGEAWGQVRVSQVLKPELESYQVHPTILDAGWQVLWSTVALEADNDGDEGIYMPVHVDQVRVHSRPCSSLWSHARFRQVAEQSTNVLEGDVRLFDETGHVVVETLGLRLQRLDREAQQSIYENPDVSLYQLQWQQARLEEEKNSNTPWATDDGIWLIFADEGGVGKSLAELLSAQGKRCILVYSGDAYERVDQDQFRIRPTQTEDIQQVLQVVLQPDQPVCRGVVHLWSLDALPPEQTTIASLETAEILGCGSVLSLLQALAQASCSTSPRLYLVTRGAQPAGAKPSPVAVAQSSLWGLARVIALEHPELQCVRVDLDPAGMPTEAQLLLKELWFGKREDQVALRREARYVLRLVRYSSELEKFVTPQPALRADSTYLITGGLGAVGLTVAQWMVEQEGARHLALLGRSSPNEHAAEVLQQLRLSGAQVLVIKADVSRPEEVAHAFAEIDRTMPELKGIIHAAGVVEDGLLMQMEQEHLTKVMRPKVNGGWNLHTQTLGRSLDFFLLFSSAAAVTGSPGLGNYTAANTFLDALAHHRRALGLPALSINWGAWSQLGMALRPAAQNRAFSFKGIGNIQPEQGLAVLKRLIRQDLAQVVAVPINFSQWRRLYPEVGDLPLLTHLVTEIVADPPKSDGSNKASLTRQAIFDAEPEEREHLLESYLHEQVARVLRLAPSQLDLRTPLINLGFDSITAIDLKNRIEKSLGVVLPMVSFLQGPTITELATQILIQLTKATLQPVLPRTLAVALGRDNHTEGQIKSDRIGQLNQFEHQTIVELTRWSAETSLAAALSDDEREMLEL